MVQLLIILDQPKGGRRTGKKERRKRQKPGKKESILKAKTKKAASEEKCSREKALRKDLEGNAVETMYEANGRRKV